MRQILFLCRPFDKDAAAQALEAGVDGLIVPPEHAVLAASLSRTPVYTPADFEVVAIQSKSDEERAAALAKAGKKVVLARGAEIIPVENLLAQCEVVGMEVASLAEAKVAAGILEKGVDTLVVLPEGLPEIRAIVAQTRFSEGCMELEPVRVTAIRPIGLGDRVCVDTVRNMVRGQGMLIGNSSRFTFLVHAETEENPYVASRPFRVNAGSVQAYAVMPGDRTRYLAELASGDEVLVVAADGSTMRAAVGRVKTEVRPMLLVEAEAEDGRKGSVVLQNAETIRVVRDSGEPVSVVSLAPGDKILARLDTGARHFGMRIQETLSEN